MAVIKWLGFPFRFLGALLLGILTLLVAVVCTLFTVMLDPNPEYDQLLTLRAAVAVFGDYVRWAVNP